MGHKVNPIGLRLGINRTWDSRWFAGDDYSKLLHEDLKLRGHLRKKLHGAGVSRVVIERPAKKPRVTIYAARPGVVIGKKGQDIEVLKKDLSRMANAEVALNIVEIRKPEIDAMLVAENIAQQLERRVAFRRAMKRAVQSAMRLGAQGIRINCGGRLGGAEIARVEWYREGRVPLHTLRADIDYGEATAKTTYGTCGVKVWVFKGEILAHDPLAQDRRAAEQAPQTVTTSTRHADGGRIHVFRQSVDGAARHDGESNEHAATEAHQVPQGAQGPHPWQCQGRHGAELRHLWAEGDGAGAADRAADRGGAARHHARDEAHRARVDPHLPRRAGVGEAGRGAHGFRQGLAGVLGVPRGTRADHVRDRRRAGRIWRARR